jgi:ABC-2 type transport system ATP-binding protein
LAGSLGLPRRLALFDDGAEMAATIEFQQLTKRYGSNLAVDGLTAEVMPGAITAFLGPNGAGKTTTLRMLLGLVTPTQGTATIDGRHYAELETPIHHVGAMLEASSFHPGRTAKDHLRILAAAAQLPSMSPVRVLEEVGLTEHANRKVGAFSLGMRQRLGLAAAMLGDPPILVLDEPTNGLDPQGIRWLRGFLRNLADHGRTVLVSSHALAEVEQTADDLLVIAHGRLIRAGSLSELRAEAGVGAKVTSPEAERLHTLLESAGYGVKSVSQDELVVDCTPEIVGALAAEHRIVLHRLVETGDLEEIFIRLTRES